VRVLFLEIEGVLNRTGFEPPESLGLRSWIEPDLAERLNGVLSATGCDLVLCSAWRDGRTLQQLSIELFAAGVEGSLVGATRALGEPRWREIEAWMTLHDLPLEAIAIVDDIADMGPLAPRFVRTSPLTGLDAAAARSIVALFA
jgi:hypothetical protein